MSEEQARVQEAIIKMIDDIDKSFLRDIQKKMHSCALKCCEDKESSVQSVQTCVDTCSRPFQRAQEYVNSELSRFQDRIQRCIMGCNDTIRDKMGPEANEAEINRYTKEFEKCAKKCIDFHIDVIPNTLKQIKYKLKNQTQ